MAHSEFQKSKTVHSSAFFLAFALFRGYCVQVAMLLILLSLHDYISCCIYFIFPFQTLGSLLRRQPSSMFVWLVFSLCY